MWWFFSQPDGPGSQSFPAHHSSKTGSPSFLAVLLIPKAMNFCFRTALWSVMRKREPLSKREEIYIHFRKVLGILQSIKKMAKSFHFKLYSMRDQAEYQLRGSRKSIEFTLQMQDSQWCELILFCERICVNGFFYLIVFIWQLTYSKPFSILCIHWKVKGLVWFKLKVSFSRER